MWLPPCDGAGSDAVNSNWITLTYVCNICNRARITKYPDCECEDTDGVLDGMQEV
jgi:hypothetical protein